MKQLILTMFFMLSLITQIEAQEPVGSSNLETGDYVVKDHINPDELVIYGKDGLRKGRIKKDPLIPDQYIQYEGYFNRVGTWRKDHLSRERWNFREKF